MFTVTLVYITQVKGGEAGLNRQVYVKKMERGHSSLLGRLKLCSTDGAFTLFCNHRLLRYFFSINSAFWHVCPRVARALKGSWKRIFPAVFQP
jgi:hypothetical protein